ncbi:flagellar motor protein MotB [Flavobacterium covae]|uniref:Flagellar motor protein MotB n=1 Tax=Flavobacterium columnare TaxID=996 RepID=A0AA94EYY4_9FLAO|nr:MULTISPECIES: OmpA family protein [Flavobacterium]AND65014.1 flagellar motor protein MotB [Flavobacterium covae]MCH4830818.1 PD40 domain-containing protein [Flavobacterium columnare]MCH4833244.1 PD40 domain-containing protein [Flavobacterium columnare]MCJ1805549.1 OmpA family protein [Flavobacterium covae]
MKRLLYISILLFSLLGFTQENNLERARKYFNRTYYSEAIPLYEKLVVENRSQEIIQNLGDSYYFTNDLKSAQRYYRFLIKNYGKDLSEEYYFRFSESLKATANYAEANQVLIDYYSKKGKSSELILLEKDLKILENVTAIGERFKIKNLEINTNKSEFGAVIYNDKLVYAATKKEPNFLDKIYKWNNESYLNLVSVPLKNIYIKDSVVNYFANELKSSMHEATPVFTADGKTMYFTRNYTKKNGRRAKNDDKISVLHIYRAQLINGKWDNIISLPINNPNYSTAHPALSPDEKMLYFSSDMPGSKGSFDIYSVEINDGLFGKPKNLGNLINTTRREQFPFVSKDNKLYFSSNGHIGFGALDVFVSDIANENFSKPTNIGLPINSGVDDFAFNIDSNTKEGFFSSNRKGGKGGDDLYFISEIKPLILEDCKQYISGIITDLDTTLPLKEVKVILYDLINKKDIEIVTTDFNGKFRFTVECEKEYTIKASKEGYIDDKHSLLVQKERNKENDASMKLKSLAKIQEEKDIAEQVKKKAEEEEKEKERAIEEEKKKEKRKEILAKEKDIIVQKDKLIIKTDPIYFDYDLWYIRRDSKPILDKVIDLMKKYPDMIVEIGSHTDIRGGKTYNLILSENRATSTKDYFIDKGIESKRIIAKGYGESQPVIKCSTEESCTEEEHELNRRSEFVIKDL